jgi:DNA mismatch endonuclease (patch repair protein)
MKGHNFGGVLCRKHGCGQIHIHVGFSGKHHNDETKRTMSESRGGVNNGFYGKHHTPENIEVLSNVHKGKSLPEEHRRKISESLSGSKNPMYGKHHKEESINRMSKAQRGENNPNYGKHLPEEQKLKIANANSRRVWKEESKIKLRERRLHQVMPFKDTTIEVKMQHGIYETGISFETHKSIFGQPDQFIAPNICIFNDGCWFHNCPTCYPDTPLPNKIARDKLVNETLTREGYTVLRFWEHEINNNLEGCLKKISEAVKQCQSQ